MPKISLIVAVYNTEKYLEECLDSVLSQTFTDFECICIDDGSTDTSLLILEKYAKRDHRIRIITQQNQGVIAARIKGILAANAEYIFMLDSDDIIAKQALEKLYQAMQQGRGDIITMRVRLIGRAAGEMYLKSPTKLNMAQQNCLVNAALFRKRDFITCGGFSPECHLGLEDYDLWLNLLFNYDKKIYRVPEVLFYYRIKSRQNSRNLQHQMQHEVLMQNFLKKYQLRTWVQKARYKKWFLHAIRPVLWVQDNGVIRIFGIRFKKGQQIKRIYISSVTDSATLFNQELFYLLGYDTELKETAQRSEIVAQGALLNDVLQTGSSPHRLRIWGTGLSGPISTKEVSGKYVWRISAVRGRHTLEQLQKILPPPKKDIVLADPALLAKFFVRKESTEKKYILAVLSTDRELTEELHSKITLSRVLFLNLEQNPKTLIPQLALCETAISSEVYGLIIADALGIPNRRFVIKKDEKQDFQCADYYSSYDGIKYPLPLDLTKQTITKQNIEEIKQAYAVPMRQVCQKQQALLQSFPYALNAHSLKDLFKTNKTKQRTE